MRTVFQSLLMGAGLVALSACGGGGGDVAPEAASGAATPASPPAPASPPPPPPPPVATSTIGDVSKATSGGLPSGLRNAAERRAFPHYIGSLKDLTGRHPKQLPMRTYFAACQTETDRPRMFVSMTLEDTSVSADPDIPTLGSVFETVYDPATKSLRRMPIAIMAKCGCSNGMASRSPASRIAMSFTKPSADSNSPPPPLPIQKARTFTAPPSPPIPSTMAVDATRAAR